MRVRKRLGAALLVVCMVAAMLTGCGSAESKRIIRIGHNQSTNHPTLGKVMPYMLMYYVAILIGLMLVTYVPFVSLGLPMAAGLI